MNLRIRELREDNDLTQKQVAAILGCGQSVYSKYENGTTALPLESLEKLADFYNVSTDYILGITDIKERYR